MAADLAIKEPCRVATTEDLASLSTLLPVDGVTVSAGDRVLVRAQASAVDNGIYVAASGAWSRATDFDGAGEVAGGTQLFVTSGTRFADSRWRVAGNGPITIGSSAIDFDPEFVQAGTDAVPRTLQAKGRETVSPFDFGAVGDGATDDTDEFLAAIAALRPGGTLWLGDGHSFVLSQTLVLERPINIRGGSKEQSVLRFAKTGSYETIGGKKAGIIALHELTVLSGYCGDSRRSVFSGLTIELQACGEEEDPCERPEDMRGFSIPAPCYFYEVDARGFTSDGFAVVAASGGVSGNANGCNFINCIAHLNEGHGFALHGSDANACLLIGCRSYGNDGDGFHDNSGSGNTYISTEVQDNEGAGYYAESGTAIRSVYLATYAETPPPPPAPPRKTYDLNPLCLLLGTQGDLGGLEGVSLQSIPTGEAYLNEPLTFADSDDVANGGGDSPAGSYARIGKLGLDLKPVSGGLHVKIASIMSTSYVDFYNGSDALIRFPNVAVTGNISTNRPFLPNGFIVGGNGLSGIVGASGAAPTTGTYAAGAIWLDDSPSPGGKIGWVCTTGGSPGTWKAFGAIDA